jgi:hypothetical protein
MGPDVMALSDDERKLRQRRRSIAIAVALGLLVVIFYATTIIRFGLHPPDVH